MKSFPFLTDLFDIECAAYWPLQNNELVLTNIGTIHLTKKPATWIGDTLHAPEQSILFTTAKIKPNAKFYTYLAEALSISN